MRRLGLIGGSGLGHWTGNGKKHEVEGPYGRPSAPLVEFGHGKLQVFFLPRHGERHEIPPHAVNYRANVHALRQAGAEGIVAVNAVGGISEGNPPGALVLPDQLIDYTWGRQHSFSLTASDELAHVDFSQPFAGTLRVHLLRAAESADLELADGGCLGVTQGPRLETAAEIRRMRSDGCDLVGMTTMPEAALAREAGLDYASLCISANWAAGLGGETVSMEAIDTTLAAAMTKVRKLLETLFREIAND